MDMMSSFEMYNSDIKATAGMYNDAAFTGLPRTIADMAMTMSMNNTGGPFVGVPPTWENMNHHATKRARYGHSSSSSSSTASNSSGSTIAGFSQSSSLPYPPSSSSSSSWYSGASQSHSESETSSVEEKKILDRERNRKQARKSRKLKKQTVDKMQQQLEQLEKESEEVAAKDKAAAKDAKDRRTRRCQALRKIFDLREGACADEESWLEVLSPDLRMTMPITPYRSFNPADVVNNRQVLLGVHGMISDTQSLAVTLDNIGVKTRRSEGPVSVKYTLGFEGQRSEDGGGGGDGLQKGAFFSRDGLMCTFNMRTLDAVKHGACQEWEVNGMVRVRFNSDTSKIEELDMTFDAISSYQQLMLAAGKEGFPPVPNTLENALKDENTRIVVTTAERPFRITHVNKAWTQLCGFELEECQGKSLSILQGPETDMKKVDKLCKLSQKGYASSMVVTNRNKKGETFRNHLRCYPVSSDEPGQISHIVGMLTSIPPSDKRRSVPAVAAF